MAVSYLLACAGVVGMTVLTSLCALLDSRDRR